MELHRVRRRAPPGEQPGRLWHCRRPRFPGDSDTALCRGETSEHGDAGWQAPPTHLNEPPHPSLGETADTQLANYSL